MIYLETGIIGVVHHHTRIKSSPLIVTPNEDAMLPLSKLTRPDRTTTTKNENLAIKPLAIFSASPQAVSSKHDILDATRSQEVGGNTSNGSKTSTSLSNDLVSGTGKGGVSRCSCAV